MQRGSRGGSGLVVAYIIAINVSNVRFPADAMPPSSGSCASKEKKQGETEREREARRERENEGGREREVESSV